MGSGRHSNSAAFVRTGPGSGLTAVFFPVAVLPYIRISTPFFFPADQLGPFLDTLRKAGRRAGVWRKPWRIRRHHIFKPQLHRVHGKPVSYTHLDVYKRQLYGTSLQGGAGSLDNNECQKEAGGKEYEGEDSADH